KGDAFADPSPRLAFADSDGAGVVHPSSRLAEDRLFSDGSLGISQGPLSEVNRQGLGHADGEETEIGLAQSNAVAAIGRTEGGLEFDFVPSFRRGAQRDR